MKENTIIPIYCQQAIQDKRIVVWGDGSRMQNYIHISDAVKLINKIVENDVKVNFPILGVSKKEYSNAQLAEIIGTHTDSEIIFDGIDVSKSVQYDNTISQKAVNWQPEMDLETRIKQFLEWKQKQF